MCLHVIFTSPVAYLGQLSTLTSVDASITSKECWLDVTHSNPSGLSLWSHCTHTHTRLPPQTHINTQFSHSPLGILLQLCKLVQASEGLVLFALDLPWFRGHIASELPVLQFLQPLQEMKINVDGGREGQKSMRRAGSSECTSVGQRGEKREISFRKLSAGSCLSNHTHQSAAFADVLLQSSCPINSIQTGRKRFSSNTQLESKHNPTGE